MEALSGIPENQRIYFDESGINQYLYRQYARGPRGEKVLGDVSGHRFARESVIAAMDIHYNADAVRKSLSDYYLATQPK